jgi:hypothetical protein
MALLKNDKAAAQAFMDFGEIDPDTFLWLAERHRIAPILLARLFHLRQTGTLADRLFPHAAKTMMVAAAVNMQFRKELKLVSENFGRETIVFPLIVAVPQPDRCLATRCM